MRSAIIWILCALLGSLAAPSSYALGFGLSKLHSYLNEPLDLDIELIDADNYTPESLIASLAAADDFKRMELQRPYFLSRLRFEIKRFGRRTFIKVRSLDAIKQPYLDFLIEIAWPGGQAVKGYTILLDPAPAGIIKTKVYSDRLDYDKSIKEKQSMENLFGPEDKVYKPTIPKMEKVIKQTTSTESTALENKLIVPIAKATANISAKIQSKAKLPDGLFWASIVGLLCIISLTIWAFNQYRYAKPKGRNNKKNNAMLVNKSPTVSDKLTKITDAPQALIEELKLKLILATQYIEIDDKQSAHKLIEEILAKGIDQQKAEAQNLLLKIQYEYT